MTHFLAAALMSPADSEVIDLKVVTTLGAFNVLVCDQSCNMADIKIQGTVIERFFKVGRIKDTFIYNTHIHRDIIVIRS